MKTPEIWQVCGNCNNGLVEYYDDAGKLQKSYPCPDCAHSPIPGYRAIPYTPEQWEAAGGVLHDELRVWFKDHHLARWENVFYKTALTWENPLYFKIIVSTPAITMKDLEEI